MALDILLGISIDSTIETATITDSTVYGTGGNPARADLRVFVNAYKGASDGTLEALTLASDDGDPQTNTLWSWTFTRDGYHKVLYVAIPQYAGGTTYAQYDSVFDASTDIVYRSKSAGNVGNALSNTTFWEVVPDPATLANNFEEANESTNITSLIYLRVLRPLSERGFANKIGESCGCNDCEDQIIPDYNLFGFWLDAAEVADIRSQVLEGEIISRRIESKFLRDC